VSKPSLVFIEDLNSQWKTRKPCYRNESAWCRSCSVQFKVCRQHSLQI